MHVENALDLSHGRFLRRIKKDQICGHDQPHERDDEVQLEGEDFTHALSLVLCPLSHVPCPMSHVTCHLSVVSGPLSVIRSTWVAVNEIRKSKLAAIFEFQVSSLGPFQQRTTDKGQMTTDYSSRTYSNN